MAESPRIEELKRRVQSDPASIAFAALAEEYRRAGRFDEAIATCRTGLQRHPSYISAHVTLGRALLEVGDYDEAREELELVLRVAPENLAAIRGLAEIHHRRGEISDAPDYSADATDTAGPTGTAASPPGPIAAPPPAPVEVRRTDPPIPVVTQPEAHAEERALAGLEELLAAILRARKGADGVHAS